MTLDGLAVAVMVIASICFLQCLRWTWMARQASRDL